MAEGVCWHLVWVIVLGGGDTGSFPGLWNAAHLKGTVNMSATGTVSKSAFSLGSQAGMPSGPEALFGLRASNLVKTECSVTVLG